jgi:hypothetical protein
MLAAAIAYNFKKWLNYKQTKAKTAVMALQKQLSTAVLHFWLQYLFRSTIPQD